MTTRRPANPAAITTQAGPESVKKPPSRSQFR